MSQVYVEIAGNRLAGHPRGVWGMALLTTTLLAATLLLGKRIGALFRA